MSDRRGIRAVCLVGDSFALGTGDPAGGGWAQRLARAAPDLTVYNLGVRRDTAADVAGRWRAEVAARAGEPSETLCILSWGVNDADPRAAGSASAVVEASVAVVDEVRADGYRCVFVGPPPVPWPEHDRRVGQVDAGLARACRERRVDYVTLHGGLPPAYRELLVRRDDAHPDGTGYDLMWSVIGPFWARVREGWQHDLDRP